MTSPPKYWVVPVKKGRKYISVDVVVHNGEAVTLIRRYPIASYQTKEQAMRMAKYDKAYFEAQGHHETWADPL
jgi:ribosomal protein L16/L10AE